MRLLDKPLLKWAKEHGIYGKAQNYKPKGKRFKARNSKPSFHGQEGRNETKRDSSALRRGN